MNHQAVVSPSVFMLALGFGFGWGAGLVVSGTEEAMKRSDDGWMSFIQPNDTEGGHLGVNSDKAVLGALYSDTEIDLALALVDRGMSGAKAMALLDELAGIKRMLDAGQFTEEQADFHAMIAVKSELKVLAVRS